MLIESEGLDKANSIVETLSTKFDDLLNRIGRMEFELGIVKVRPRPYKNHYFPKSTLLQCLKEAQHLNDLLYTRRQEADKLRADLDRLKALDRELDYLRKQFPEVSYSSFDYEPDTPKRILLKGIDAFNCVRLAMHNMQLDLDESVSSTSTILFSSIAAALEGLQSLQAPYQELYQRLLEKRKTDLSAEASMLMQLEALLARNSL